MFRNQMKAAVVGVGLLAMSSVQISAHHSFGSVYDASKEMTIKGTVTKVERVNPHGWIYVDVKNPNGGVENWVIETGTPQELARRGILKDTLPIGIELEVRGYRAKSGSKMLNGNVIKLPDGRELTVSAGSPAAGAATNAPTDSKPSGEAPR